MANDFILGESGIMKTGKTVPKVTRGANADVLDSLFANTKDIAKEVGNVGKSTIKTGKINPIAEYSPYIGDIYDIVRGGYQATHGHPFVGTGQALLGVAGLGANVLFPGSGSVAKAGVKGGIKGIAKAGSKAILKQGGKQTANTIKNAGKALHSTKGQLATAIIPEFFYGDGNETSQPINNEGLQTNNIQPTKNGAIGRNVSRDDVYQNPYTGQLDSIEAIINNARANGHGYNGELDNRGNIIVDSNGAIQPNSIGGSVSGNIDLSRLEDRYKRQQELQKPYIEGLQNLINNYNDLQRNAMNLDRYYTGLAGWSGNDRWADFGKRYNPITTEATKLDLLNKLAQGQIGIDNLENEMRGNIALAQQAGVDPNVAMANPKLFSALASIENAKTSAEARKYVADQNRDARLAGIYSNAMIQKAKQDGNYDLALRLQSMRNDGRLQSAIVNAISFGADPSVIYNALQGYGYNVGNGGQQTDELPPKETITTANGNSTEAGKASNLINNYKR